MNKSTLLSLSTLILFLLSINIASAQEALYTELFDEDGVGLAGECTGTDQSTCATNVLPTNEQWTITGDISGLTATVDFLRTDGGSLEARDIDEELCFLSSIIDISNHENISLVVELRENSDLENTDHVDVTYIVDGTATLISDLNGQGSATHTLIGDAPDDEDWGTESIDQAIPEGDELQIQICLLINADNERIFLDEVAVLGDAKAVVAAIPTMSQWSMFILGLMMMSIGVIFIGNKKRVERVERVEVKA